MAYQKREITNSQAKSQLIIPDYDPQQNQSNLKTTVKYNANMHDYYFIEETYQFSFYLQDKIVSTNFKLFTNDKFIDCQDQILKNIKEQYKLDCDDMEFFIAKKNGNKKDLPSISKSQNIGKIQKKKNFYIEFIRNKKINEKYQRNSELIKDFQVQKNKNNSVLDLVTCRGLFRNIFQRL